MKYFTALLFLFMMISCGVKTSSTSSTDKIPPADTMEDMMNLLSGKWKLSAIKFFPQDEIIVPQKDYFVEFIDTRFHFNKEVNKCQAKYKISLPDNIQIAAEAGCTKMCCDKDISDELMYQNVSTFSVERNKLTLKGEGRKFEFTKTEK